HGEQEVHRIFKRASIRIAKRQPVFQALAGRLEDLERRIQPIADRYKARSKELGRDVTIPFPSALHWGLIVFLGFGEFPLNTVVFRLFGEPEFLTYVMASTLALIIPLIGVFIGIHMRHALPRMAGNILIGLLTPITVGGALYAVSLLRNTYITSQFSAGAPSGSARGSRERSRQPRAISNRSGRRPASASRCTGRPTSASADCCRHPPSGGVRSCPNSTGGRRPP